jgi:orotate phosphoribosyltransferase
MSHLFNTGSFKLHSGGESSLKIDCDALTVADWETLAVIISKTFAFREVIGIPTGGMKLAAILKKYTSKNSDDPILIVDDVLSTGASMITERERLKAQGVGVGDIVGVVAFARNTTPNWIVPIFTINPLVKQG